MKKILLGFSLLVSASTFANRTIDMDPGSVIEIDDTTITCGEDRRGRDSVYCFCEYTGIREYTPMLIRGRVKSPLDGYYLKRTDCETAISTIRICQ